MKGFTFDPNRLACSPREQERRGYAMAARLLREYLGGGDIFAEVRRCRQVRSGWPASPAPSSSRSGMRGPGVTEHR